MSTCSEWTPDMIVSYNQDCRGVCNDFILHVSSPTSSPLASRNYYNQRKYMSRPFYRCPTVITLWVSLPLNANLLSMEHGHSSCKFTWSESLQSPRTLTILDLSVSFDSNGELLKPDFCWRRRGNVQESVLAISPTYFPYYKDFLW